MIERLITTLFADDTTVYLRQYDRWETLHETLDNWCKASGAKFNIDKTKLLPIGSPEYRQQVIATRRLDPSQNEIPPYIEIVGDGVPARSLGCQIGNRVDEPAQWNPALTKVDSGLDRWGNLYPTLNGKRHVANFTAAGYTQYLAKVQEIPKEVEQNLIKRLRTFIWGSEKAPPLALRKLYDPIEEGGLKLIDLETRTEAIRLTWLQNYLKFGPERPRWAFVVDALINKNISKSGPQAPEEVRINVMTQTWNANLFQQTSLPREISEMFKVGKKYGIHLMAPQPTLALQSQLPVWYPIGQDPSKQRRYTSKECECLRAKHRILTV
ncbi:hypothetical protein K525DRAFT_211037, partial [Schizophyllum commune Loenen D]